MPSYKKAINCGGLSVNGDGWSVRVTAIATSLSAFQPICLFLQELSQMDRARIINEVIRSQCDVTAVVMMPLLPPPELPERDNGAQRTVA